MILSMRDTKAVKKAKKIGGSVMLPLTGFIQADCFYKVERSDRQVVITRIDV